MSRPGTSVQVIIVNIRKPYSVQRKLHIVQWNVQRLTANVQLSRIKKEGSECLHERLQCVIHCLHIPLQQTLLPAAEQRQSDGPSKNRPKRSRVRICWRAPCCANTHTNQTPFPAGWLRKQPLQWMDTPHLAGPNPPSPDPSRQPRAESCRTMKILQEPGFKSQQEHVFLVRTAVLFNLSAWTSCFFTFDHGFQTSALRSFIYYINRQNWPQNNSLRSIPMFVMVEFAVRFLSTERLKPSRKSIVRRTPYAYVRTRTLYVSP